MEKRDYYSTSECADILKVSRITVFNWIKRKKIQAVKLGGNYVVPMGELERVQQVRGLREEDRLVLRSFVHGLLKDYSEFLKVID